MSEEKFAFFSSLNKFRSFQSGYLTFFIAFFSFPKEKKIKWKKRNAKKICVHITELMIPAKILRFLSSIDIGMWTLSSHRVNK